MKEKIFNIKKELENQGISETRIALMIGEDQTKINRLLSGKTKKPDFVVVEKLCGALGMAADPGPGYASDRPFQVVQEIGPEKKKASSPLAAAILALVEAMTPEQQAAELKRLTDQFTSSQTTEKS